MEGRSEARHFLDYLRVLQSRKETVMGVSLMIILAGLLITLSLDKEYMATTRMTITRVRPDVPVFEARDMEGWYNPFYLKTQLEVIQSQHVLDKVIENLKLRERFVKGLDAQGPLDVADARAMLRRSMSVRPYLDTNIIEINVYRKRPKDTVRQDVMEIANEVARVYKAVSTEDSRMTNKRGADALHEEYMGYEKQVGEKETSLEDLRKKLNITMIGRFRSGEEGSALEKIRLQELEGARIQARKEMLERKGRLDKLVSLHGDELLYSLAYLKGDPTILTLRRDLTEARLKLKNLQETHGDKHPDVLRNLAVTEEINKEIKEAVEGVKVALQTDYEIANKHFEEVEKDLDAERKGDIQGSRERYLPFFRAEQELDHLRHMRDTLKTRWIEEKVKLELPQTPVMVIDEAEMPGQNEYVSPKLLLNMALSILFGLCCGVALAFFSEYMDTSVKTIEEIEQYMGVSVLGVIPQKVKSLIDAGAGSPHAESYRVLRTNMQFSKKLAGGKAVCITSGGAGEGKSFTVANLAYVCAQLGDRVLVIDGDLRRPRQHKIFGVPRKPGLSEVLSAEAKVDDVIQKTSVPNLFLLPSGRSSVATVGLLDIQRVRDLIEYLKGKFDSLLLDAPPVVGVSDASVLVSVVDGVLLVIQHRSYPKALSVRARKLVENVGANLMGIVLNNINISRDYYYYYHAYPSNYAYSRPDPEAMQDAERDTKGLAERRRADQLKA